MAVLALCLVLAWAAMMSGSVMQGLSVEKSRSWSASWARLQAQALGHGLQQWALAQMEDQRAVDDHCLVLEAGDADPPTARGRSFGVRMVRDGVRMACAAEPDLVEARSPWRCECGLSAPQARSGAGSAELLLEFDAQDALMLMRVSASVSVPGQVAPATWRESVLLRRDEASVWRAVVGSWLDGR